MESLDVQRVISTTEVDEEKIVELPVEIHIHVIEFLDSERDIVTLTNCARVCRAWLPYSRSKLYQIVVLDDFHQWTRFLRLLAYVETGSSVGKYMGKVQKLQVGSGVDWGDGRWVYPVLSECATHLTGLINITLYQADWILSPNSGSFFGDGNHYRSVTDLHIYESIFSDVLQLHQVVTSFPALSNLTLKGISLRSVDDFPSSFPGQGPQLKRLSLLCSTSVDAVVVSQWLADAQLVSSLEFLWCVNEEAIQNITLSILNGQSLRELDCSVARARHGLNNLSLNP